MTEELSGRRIVVPETRELGQLLRMLEERGADTVPCPMIAIRDAPDAVPIHAWLRRFVREPCDDLILMTGEGSAAPTRLCPTDRSRIHLHRCATPDTQDHAWTKASPRAARDRI